MMAILLGLLLAIAIFAWLLWRTLSMPPRPQTNGYRRFPHRNHAVNRTSKRAADRVWPADDRRPRPIGFLDAPVEFEPLVCTNAIIGKAGDPCPKCGNGPCQVIFCSECSQPVNHHKRSCSKAYF
jgi:hypothetical protein